MEYLFSGGEGCLWKGVAFVVAIALMAHGLIGWGILLFLVLIFLLLRLIISLKSARSTPTVKTNLLAPETSSPYQEQEDFYPVPEEVAVVDNMIRDVLEEMNYQENKKPVPAKIVPSSPQVPDDLDNILQAISQGKIKDAVTQGRFRPKDKVYLCLAHRLAYHEDTWQLIGYQCEVCGDGKKTKLYTLPPSNELGEKPVNPFDSEISEPKVYISEESIDL